MQQATGSYAPVGDSQHDGRTESLHQVGALEARFIQNWSALARAFGMDPMLGRVHALCYLSDEPVTPLHVGAAIGIGTDQARHWLEELHGWGVLEARDSEEHGTAYLADADPWSFFLTTLKERGKREFGPLMRSIREAAEQAERLSRSSGGPQRTRLQRIARFTQFVEQIANLVESFASLGAGPMLTAMRMVAKMKGPRLLRM